MAGTSVVLAPGNVYVVKLPDESLYPEPYVFIRQDQADCIVFEDGLPWTQDAWEQMFPPGKCDENHTKTRKQGVR